MLNESIKNLGGFVWSIAEILRGDFKQFEYGKIILPFVVLRRLDCVLENSKDAVLDMAKTLPEDIDDEARDMILFGAAGDDFKVYNLSPFTFATMRNQDAAQIHANLVEYVTKFSPNVRDIFLEKFEFLDQLKRINNAGILWQVFDAFCQIDLHADKISNLEMGYLFEELIRKFSEISNETAGEHFTPREVIRLMVDLSLANDTEALAGTGVIRQVYDPTSGTGGMLSIAEASMKEMNERIRVELFGQELNPESFAICKSDMLLTGHDPEQIAFGNSLTEDKHADKKFHYMFANPPYGVDWKKYKDPILEEAAELGFDGRFGPGTPRVSDGQLLFLMHMISKMRDDEKGSRIAIVMNGSPLFTGGAGSGESEIRRWILENDWLEAIVALPTDIFYNTGIQTYIWILTNRKTAERYNKVQLIDASSERFWKSMRKSLGSKRREIPDHARDEITRIFHEMLNGGDEDWSDYSKFFSTTDFGYREVRVERPLKLRFDITEDKIDALKNIKALAKLPEATVLDLQGIMRQMPQAHYMDRKDFLADLKKQINGQTYKIGASIIKAITQTFATRDDEAAICLDNKGNPEPDSDLRDHELVPLNEDIQEYFNREVLPFVPDAWIESGHTDSKDEEIGRVGYEINFNRYFYKYVPPRPLAEIDAELKTLESEIANLLKEVTA